VDEVSVECAHDWCKPHTYSINFSSDGKRATVIRRKICKICKEEMRWIDFGFSRTKD
jgi:hypothetical protein